jgi:pimeloyl-ACP methyl ester carboxylesterase
LLAAEKDLGIAGVVCLAGIGRNLYDTTLEQTEAAMKDQPAMTRAGNMKVQREFQDAVKEGREPKWDVAGAAAAETLKGVWKKQILPVKKWWHEHFVIDLPAIHTGLTCPVFVANGSADFQVNPEKDARQIAKNLMAGKCTDVTLRIYDDLDHLFKPCGGKESTIKMYYEKRSVNAKFIEDVVRWLEQHA